MGVRSVRTKVIGILMISYWLRWSYSPSTYNSHTLTVRNPDGIVEPIAQIPNHKGCRTAGGRLAQDGTNRDELNHLTDSSYQDESTPKRR
mmetsp:Transcript_18772/g.38884  ORF Transcript_18772/g.38884 Transcript_18772/m.38884 type:complete len:90 (+) Transcript_18772:2809-3078(+)